jgi:predicted ATPase/DNA-binding XRE family transcriptional regulator
MPEASFGKLLCRLRRGAGLSQEMLAERAGVSVKTVSALENGARRNPYHGTVALLADALSLSKKARATLAAAAVRPYRPREGARSTLPPKHNLPAQLSSFVGREDALAEVGALIARQRLVTLTGTGGMGKTRLALRVAERIVGSWSDGVWFVDLASLDDPARVAERAATVLGVAGIDPRPISERLIAALRSQHMLIVLDNCEHVLADVARLVATVLPECPRVTILATSRERLNIPGERTYDVPSLAVPRLSTPSVARTSEGVLLFAERARSITSFALNDDNAPVVAEICRRLDGIPLAIELAAARTRELSVHDIARHLDDRFRILIAGARTAARRQQTMRAAIDWSVDALSAPALALFQRLGIFAGGWTLDAAAKVCSDEGEVPFDVLERLSSLVEKSLVVADTSRIRTRYRLLESTRIYALERLSKSRDHRDVASRHARWFATFCDEAREAIYSKQFAPWLASVGEELENIRAALRWAVSDSGDATLALRLASSLGPFWRFVGLSDEGRRWLEAALARGGDCASGEIVASAWRNLAALGSGTKALAAAGRAVELDELVGDPFAIALSRRVRALTLVSAGHLNEAETDIDDAIRLLRDLGMLGTITHAHALNARQLVLKERGRLTEAREALEAALAIYTEFGDEFHAATAQGNLAELAFGTGDCRRALELVRANRAWGQVNSVAMQSTSRANEAAYCLALGDTAGARDAAREGLALSQRAQQADVFLAALQHLATVAANGGDVRTGALILGYVDYRNRIRGYEREATERRTYEIAIRALDALLPAEERNQLMAAGEELDEERAVELAVAIV